MRVSFGGLQVLHFEVVRELQGLVLVVLDQQLVQADCAPLILLNRGSRLLDLERLVVGRAHYESRG